MKILSVIVPVYNVEKYLDQCLDSLVNQTLQNFEILVVNDGATDHSQKIIDEYASAYPHLIKALIKQNGGLSDARNFGLKQATGQYLAFLDSDDYVEKDLYENMILLAQKQEADLVVADLEYFWDDQSQEAYVMKGLNKQVNEDWRKALFLSPLFSWNKLYRRELFTHLQLQYPVGKWYEDIPVTLTYFSQIQKMAYYEQVGFHYRQRSTSILGSGYDKRMFHIFDILEMAQNKLKSLNCYEEFKVEMEYLYVEHFLFYGAFRFLRTEHYKALMDKAFSTTELVYPDWRKNPYLLLLGRKNRVFLKLLNQSTIGFWHWYLTRK